MWNVIWWCMLIVYVPSCIGLIIIVLLQKGKGTGFAGAFGVGGGSDAVFGPRAGRSLPRRLTTVMAALFMILALGMTIVSTHGIRGDAPEKVDAGVLENAAPSTGLEDLGLGTGTPGAADAADAATTTDDADEAAPAGSVDADTGAADAENPS